MGITKKERFLKAHFELLRRYLNNMYVCNCPLCEIVRNKKKLIEKDRDCYFCTQFNKGKNCTNMKTFIDKGDSYELRQKYHFQAIQILREIPKERFTKKGHVGFPELFKLDDRLYQEYLRSRK